MGNVSEKKKREENQKRNNEVSIRIGAIALVNVLLAIVYDSISLFNKNEVIGLIIGLLSLMVVLYGIQGKWLLKLKNKNLVRKIIDFGTVISALVFAVEKIGLYSKDKIMMSIVFGTYGVAIIVFIIILVKSKDWNYNVD